VRRKIDCRGVGVAAASAPSAAASGGAAGRTVNSAPMGDVSQRVHGTFFPSAAGICSGCTATGPLSGVCARICAALGSLGAGCGWRPSSPLTKSGMLSLQLPTTTTLVFGDCARASVASIDFQRK
jgi:hypothetical protein